MNLLYPVFTVPRSMKFFTSTRNRESGYRYRDFEGAQRPHLDTPQNPVLIRRGDPCLNANCSPYAMGRHRDRGGGVTLIRRPKKGRSSNKARDVNHYRMSGFGV